MVHHWHPGMDMTESHKLCDLENWAFPYSLSSSALGDVSSFALSPSVLTLVAQLFHSERKYS